MVQKAKTRIASIFSIVVAFFLSFFLKSPDNNNDKIGDNNNLFIDSAVAADAPAGALHVSQPATPSPAGVLHVAQPDATGSMPAGALHVAQPGGSIPAGALHVTQPDGSTGYLSINNPGAMLPSSVLKSIVDTQYFSKTDFEAWLSSKRIDVNSLSELEYSTAASIYRDTKIYDKLSEIAARMR